MDDLVSPCQSAFISGRSIQDNFLYVQNIAKHYHQTKTPALLLKLDIAKAFDTVSWTYILDMLHARGFPVRWRNWIALLFRTASSKVLISGAPGRPIEHRRGLRQGASLSPFLFDLAMEPLHRLLDLASGAGILSKLRGSKCTFRASIYADDVALFINPTLQDIQGLQNILTGFGRATGLQTNLAKSSITPISCDGIDTVGLAQNIGITVNSFPCVYLGMPLSIKKLTKADWQALLDKVDKYLATWKAKMMSKAGRLEMLNSVLSSLPVYLMTINDMPALVQIAPELYKISIRKNRTVKEALENKRWLLDLRHHLDVQHLPQLFRLAHLIDSVHLTQQPDDITWRFGAKPYYSAGSAYRLQFLGAVGTDFKKIIWKGWAPARCKFFIWTLMLERILTADKLLQRGWENDYFCPLCRRNLETASHIFTECPFSLKVWEHMAVTLGLDALKPTNCFSPLPNLRLAAASPLPDLLLAAPKMSGSSSRKIAAANGFRRCSLTVAEAWALYHTRYPVPLDMRLPSSSGWKMVVNGIGVPPPPKPGTDQWRDGIKARRAQLSAEERLDPTWAANNNDDWWKAYFKAKYDVEMHNNDGLVGGTNSWNKDGRALFWGAPGRTLENVIRGIHNGTPRLETPSSPPPSPRGGPPQWQPRRMTSSSSNSSSSGPTRSTPSSSYRSAPYSVPKREVKEEPTTPVNTRRGGSGSRRQQERRCGALLIP
ncbi:hypothetical protein QYE76_021651 [Lolium multiflorum]|uniref:Reverse transcriptase domain-containing protein n=1 Tax=Lolium multiflorum TaxID=4521 RepID=A0AAD8R9X6_LOLMU|nr:hypothetical protein QYE76_021651 [Lolium multiflorum]